MSLPLSVYKRMPRRMPLSLGFDRYALYFDGEDDYAVAPLDMAKLITNKAFTVEAMVYWLSHGRWAKIISTDYRQDGSWSAPWVFFTLSQYSDEGTWEYFGVTVRKLDGTLVHLNYDTGIPVELKRWVHVVGRTWIEGTTMYAELWLNGQLKHSYTVEDVDNYDYGSSDRIFIAVRSSFSPGEWGHHITAFARIYNRLLSEGEVRYNMLNYHNPVRDGLVLWLDFEEGHGDKAYDRSGQGNHGTIYGAKWVKVRQYELRAEVGL